MRIKSKCKDRTLVVHLPVSADGGQNIRRGVIDRAAMTGQQTESSSAKMSLVVTKLTVPTTITLLPMGKKGDTSEQLPNDVRNAPDVLRKIKNREIDIIEK